MAGIKYYDLSFFVVLLFFIYILVVGQLIGSLIYWADYGNFDITDMHSGGQVEKKKSLQIYVCLRLC